MAKTGPFAVRCVLASLLGVAVLQACNSDDNQKANDSGGSSGAAGTAGLGGSGGSAASGGTSGAGGDAGTLSGFDGIWKQDSARVIVIDPANPLGVTDRTITIPPSAPAPTDGRQVEIYQGFENDSLVVYAYYAGDSVYYKARQSLTRAGDGYFGTLGDASHVYQLKDGHVVDVTSSSLGSVQFTGEVTFTRYQAAFPPSSWPRQSVDLP